jgi:small redox-active disulfide protein 2
MKTIKILGTGCPNCKRAEAVVKNVVEELQSDDKIVKVEDIQDIMAYNILSTPAIVIDEKVVIKGRVPSKDEMRELLKENCCSDTDSSCCEPAESKNDSSCGGDENSNTSCC